MMENPQAFVEVPGDKDPDHLCPGALTLVLFIIFEMTLGKDSYWYPYFMHIQITRVTCHWEKSVIREMQDD